MSYTEEFILVNKLNVHVIKTINDTHIHCAVWKYAEEGQKHHQYPEEILFTTRQFERLFPCCNIVCMFYGSDYEFVLN